MGIAEAVESIRDRIRTAQMKAVCAANREAVMLSWHVGRDILEYLKLHPDDKDMGRLAFLLDKVEPGLIGYGDTSLLYRKSFAEAYPDEALVREVFARLPLRHNWTLLDWLDSPEARLWYAQKAFENGWSRDVLRYHIESNLYAHRVEPADTSTGDLPPFHSGLTLELLRDPDVFLMLLPDCVHQKVKDQLLHRLRNYLLESRMGFAFVGTDYYLGDGKEGVCVDLLLYHTRLHCYVAINLVMEEYKRDFAGRMSVHLADIEKLLSKPPDQPPIGIILCKGPEHFTVEYVLRDKQSLMGVATYRELPEDLQAALPSPARLKAELQGEDIGKGEISEG